MKFMKYWKEEGPKGRLLLRWWMHTPGLVFMYIHQYWSRQHLFGHTFMSRNYRYSQRIRTTNQIRRSYKNDQSNIFVTVYCVTWKCHLIPSAKLTWRHSILLNIVANPRLRIESKGLLTMISGVEWRHLSLADGNKCWPGLSFTREYASIFVSLSYIHQQ